MKKYETVNITQLIIVQKCGPASKTSARSSLKQKRPFK